MIEKIAPKLYLVESPDKGRLPFCYCLYIEGEIRALIDTSCGSDNIRVLRERGVDRIINTHFHEDHILLNHQLPGAEVWAHCLDAPAIRSLEVFNRFYGFPQYGLEELGRDFIADVGLEASPVHRYLEEGQVLDLGGISCRILHTPGHTPGHCCFHFENEDLLFSADLDLAGFGPWYGNVCGNVTDLIASIRRCQALKPGRVLSSHKGLIANDLEARFQRYLDSVFRREDAVLEALQRPQSLAELTALKIVYGPQTRMDDFFWFMEKVSIQLHLDRLVELGQVGRQDELYYRI